MYSTAFYYCNCEFDRREDELCLLPLIILLMMVPIDSSRQELSNGCLIVILSNFDFYHENPAVGLDLDPLGDKLALFLADFIGKICSNEA